MLGLLIGTLCLVALIAVVRAGRHRHGPWYGRHLADRIERGLGGSWGRFAGGGPYREPGRAPGGEWA